jgi:hypothetical protein
MAGLGPTIRAAINTQYSQQERPSFLKKRNKKLLFSAGRGTTGFSAPHQASL